jgi:hypothetical protein
MGGSGSGGSWVPTAPSNQCVRLAFRASINSPQPNIVSSLTIGNVLDVKLQTTPTIAVIAVLAGTAVGALTGTQVNALVNCIQNGYRYEATVVAVVGGKCTVDVRHI